LRKLAALALALPVLALVYLAVMGRAGVARLGAAIAAAAIVALVAVAAVPPAPSNAVPAATPAPVDARVIDALTTGHGLREPFSVEFDAPMDPASVAATLRLVPDAAVRFTWDETGRELTIAPLDAWAPDTLYVLTVAATARAADGASLARPVRAAVLTAPAGSATIQATRVDGKRVRVNTAFRIQLDRPVSPAAVRAAFTIEPAVGGTVAPGSVAGEYLFTPSASLAVNTSYTITLDGLADADGVPFGTTPELTFRTAGAPEVVRFRPVDGETKVERTAAISVRFTEAMKRDTTAKAFSVTANGARVAGDLSWAEGGTVLVFVPAKALPYGAKVKATVAGTAVAKSGARLAEAATGSFSVMAKPKAKPAPAPATKPTKIKHSGGGGAAKAGWYGVETYYLRLMNCTRTGGWVTRAGKCSSPGGRDVRPLTLNAGISNAVSRPYAKLLATRNICSHFINGTPGDRLRRQGYTSYRWGENLGCRSGNPYSAVLGSHLYFQSEKPYNGGHYRNLMDARFHQVGIGVWVSGGRVRLVIDFYTP
jgi:hypothetical protein